MLSNLELYGTEDVPVIPKEVCDERLKLLRNRLEELMSSHYMNRDNNAINNVLKVQEHWKRLRDGENE